MKPPKPVIIFADASKSPKYASRHRSVCQRSRGTPLMESPEVGRSQAADTPRRLCGVGVTEEHPAPRALHSNQRRLR